MSQKTSMNVRRSLMLVISLGVVAVVALIQLERGGIANYLTWTWAAAAVCWILAGDVKQGQVTPSNPSASRTSGALNAVSHVAFGVMIGIAVAGGSLLAPIALAMVPAVLAHVAVGPSDRQSVARPRDHSRAE